MNGVHHDLKYSPWVGFAGEYLLKNILLILLVDESKENSILSDCTSHLWASRALVAGLGGVGTGDDPFANNCDHQFKVLVGCLKNLTFGTDLSNATKKAASSKSQLRILPSYRFWWGLGDYFPFGIRPIFRCYC